MPSGFYLKFGDSGWTKLFGSTGSNTPKKWSASTGACGGKAQLAGVTYDGSGQADMF